MTTDRQTLTAETLVLMSQYNNHPCTGLAHRIAQNLTRLASHPALAADTMLISTSAYLVLRWDQSQHKAVSLRAH